MNIYIRQNIPDVTTAWIYHSSNLWLISISSDWTNWTTISDKNVWATAAWTTSANYWNYYSWWATEDRNWKSASSYTMQEDWSLWNQTIATNWFHIPTQAEWTNIITMLSNLIWESSLNYNHAMQYFLLPRAWQMLDSSTSVSYAETKWWWYYWTSTKSSTTAAYLLRATSSALNSTWSWIKFPRWFSVRLFKDTWYTPTTDWDVIYDWGLRSYSKIISMSEQWQVVLSELNNHPADYYNKLNSEWHIIGNGIADTTGQNYQNFNDWTWSYYFMLYVNWTWALDV